MSTDERTPFEGWAILELMGHRRLAGYLSEETVAGGAFVRIDVPGPSAEEADSVLGWFATQFYAPAAVYCITPTSEETARLIAARNKPTPAYRWELEPAPVYAGRDDDDPDLDDDKPF